MLAAHPQHIAHLLASSPMYEHGQHNMPTSSPAHSPASDMPRYFSEHEYTDSVHGYSSPPSSVTSSQSFSTQSPFPSFADICHTDMSYHFSSSPLSHTQPFEQQHPHLRYPGFDARIAPSPAPVLSQQGTPLMSPINEASTYLGPNDMYNHTYQAPRAAMIPGLNKDRPEMKRRKTCSDMMDSSSPTKQPRRDPKDKRGAGKDGEDVWPEDVEAAFFESVRLVPKLGRKKIVVNGKPCGRNELIGDYIRRKTGRIRSRKQVSSHIQVLKNIKRHEPEFMNLVAEPKPGEAEEDFSADTSALFFAPQEFAHVTCEAPESPEFPPYPTASLMPFGAGAGQDGLLSPYCGSFFSSQASSSGASSPALSSCSSIPPTRSVSPYPYILGGTPVDDLPAPLQVFQLKLAPPSPAGHVPAGPITGADMNATPKCEPSKLGHRRMASKGLVLTIPPNSFGASQIGVKQEEQNQLFPIDAAINHSQPTTPWPQLVHTPTCAPNAPVMLGSPSQRNRLPQIWATTTADWNKASPALEGSFEQELSAAVASSKSMQNAAARPHATLKRSYTDVPITKFEPKHEEPLDIFHRSAGREDADSFFSNLLGSRAF